MSLLTLKERVRAQDRPLAPLPHHNGSRTSTFLPLPLSPTNRQRGATLLFTSKCLQRLAMSLVRESLWSDGCLFGRSQKEDSPSLTTAAHEQERGCPGFLCEPLLCKTLRQGGQ